MPPLCLMLVTMLPLGAYLAFSLYTSFRAQGQIVAGASGFWKAFRRESYTELGWKLYTRTVWLFVGFLPIAIGTILLARLLCWE